MTTPSTGMVASPRESAADFCTRWVFDDWLAVYIHRIVSDESFIGVGLAKKSGRLVREDV